MTGLWPACFMHHNVIAYLTISYPRSGAKVPLALLNPRKLKFDITKTATKFKEILQTQVNYNQNLVKLKVSLFVIIDLASKEE